MAAATYPPMSYRRIVVPQEISPEEIEKLEETMRLFRTIARALQSLVIDFLSLRYGFELSALCRGEAMTITEITKRRRYVHLKELQFLQCRFPSNLQLTLGEIINVNMPKLKILNFGRYRQPGSLAVIRVLAKDPVHGSLIFRSRKYLSGLPLPTIREVIVALVKNKVFLAMCNKDKIPTLDHLKVVLFKAVLVNLPKRLHQVLISYADMRGTKIKDPCLRVSLENKRSVIVLKEKSLARTSSG